MMKVLRYFTLAIILFPAVLTGQQVENGGFELWENAGTIIDEPTDWSSIKTSDGTLGDMAPVVWGRVSGDSVHSGAYCLKLINIATLFDIVATGTMVNGRIHANINTELAYSYTDTLNAQWHTVLTQRPDSLVGWFRYYPKGNDILQVKALLHVDEGKLPENGTLPNWVGLASFESQNATYDSWTRFSVPFVYFNESYPEFILINLTSGNGTTPVDSSIALYDDIQLVYENSGIHEESLAKTFLHLSGDRLVIDLADPQEYTGKWLHVIDVTGRPVFDEQLTGRITSPLPSGFSPGIYVAFIHHPKGIYTQKFYIE